MYAWADGLPPVGPVVSSLPCIQLVYISIFPPVKLVRSIVACDVFLQYLSPLVTFLPPCIVTFGTGSFGVVESVLPTIVSTSLKSTAPATYTVLSRVTRPVTARAPFKVVSELTSTVPIIVSPFRVTAPVTVRGPVKFVSPFELRGPVKLVPPVALRAPGIIVGPSMVNDVVNFITASFPCSVILLLPALRTISSSSELT